jgi:hypothetical protein
VGQTAPLGWDRYHPNPYSVRFWKRGCVGKICVVSDNGRQRFETLMEA